MATGNNTRYSQEMAAHLTNDQRALDRMTRQKYGMGADEMHATLNILTSLSRGQTPTAGSAEERYVLAAAKSRYGLSANETTSLLRDIAKMPAHERIPAYFSAGGRSQADPQTVQMATRFVSEFSHEDMKSTLNERLDERKSNHAHTTDRFTHLKPDSRALQDVKDRQDLRNNLRQAMGADTSQPSLDQMRDRVATARNRLADRLDAQTIITATTGAVPNLKESLSESFDLHYLDGASKDLGMGSPLNEANQHVSENLSHMQPDYDVTEDLRSNND